MESPAALIDSFYAAFQRRDHAAMAACYAPDATFSDPVFPLLRGPAVAAMWRMLCERGTDLRIAVSEIEADENRGSARWEAWYTFAGTGRPVHNVIHASFRFRNGLIEDHRDAFDLHRWAGQALGPTGVLLGWTPYLQRAIRAQAALALDRHAVGRPAGSPQPTRRRRGGCATLVMAALLLIGLGSVWLLVRIGGTSDGPGALLVYVAAVGGLAGAWIIYALGRRPR